MTALVHCWLQGARRSLRHRRLKSVGVFSVDDDQPSCEPLRYFQQAAAIDLADNHTTIAGGLHMAALGGTWLTAIVGFAGFSLRSDGIAFDPKLPASWTILKFGMKWRGRCLRIGIDGAERFFHATLEAGDPMVIYVNDRRHQIRCDQAMVCPLT